MTPPTEAREAFTTRHRRGIALTLWLGSVAATVLAYYATMPKPLHSALTAPGSDPTPTIQVGALPVT